MTNINMDKGSEIPIGDLCKELGISTRTLRYWEEVGIIESVDRGDRVNRSYTPYMVRRIKFILRLRDLGLTIKEMQHLYRVYGDAKKTDRLIPELVKIFDQHLETIEDKIEMLTTLHKEISVYRERMLGKLRKSEQDESSAN